MTHNVIGRRQFLRSSLGAAAGTSLLSVGGARAMAAPLPTGRVRRRPTVAIFGGGVAGLTAAHELADRGFRVTGYERRAWGGKARSFGVPGTGTDGRRPLPGEHAFRFVFAGYQNLPDTMRRIPFGQNPNGVYDNLIAAPQIGFARDRNRPNYTLPLGALDPRPYTPEQVLNTLLGVLRLGTSIPPDQVAYLAQRLIVFFSSGQARRLGEWENTSWAQFVNADRFCADYRKMFSDALTRQTIAARADTASARTIGNGFESVIYLELTGRATTKLLDLPTNEAWIDPWVTELTSQGVDLNLGHTLTGFDFNDGHITAARLTGPRGPITATADYYICALPVERARQLWTRAMLSAAPRLTGMQRLQTAWMNGIQFYLHTPTPITKGFTLYVDSPWALESVNQAEMWRNRNLARDYGDGTVREDLSVCICDWSEPGVVYGKPAAACTVDQIAREVWEQMKQHLNKPGHPPTLSDDMIVTWNLDPGLVCHGDRIVDNADPLTINTVGSWANRPSVTTTIPNLLLAGDYVQVDFDITSMEGANESGRRAANAVLDAVGSNEQRCQIYERLLPQEWEAFRRLDDQRFSQAEPNLFDEDLDLADLTSRLRSGASRRGA